MSERAAGDRDGRDDARELSSGVVERTGDRRVAAVAVAAVVLLLAGFVAGRTGRGADPSVPASAAAPGTAGAGTNGSGATAAPRDPALAPARRAGPGTSISGPLRPAGPTMRTVAVEPADLPCGQLRPDDPLPAGIPGPVQALTAPTTDEGALVPGSTSVAFEPADSWVLSPIAGDTGMLATINIAGLSITALGTTDDVGFDRQVTFAGCTAEQPLPHGDHVWLLLHTFNTTFLVDADRRARAVAFAARCDGCEFLRDGGADGVWVFGWQGTRGPRDEPAGSLVRFAVGDGTHEIRGPLLLGEDGLPTQVAGGLYVVRSGIRLARLDPDTGATLATTPANARTGWRDAPAVFDAGGALWVIEDDERLVARSLDDLSILASIDAPGIAAVDHGGDDVWFQRVAGDDRHDLELVHVDARTRTVVSRRTFRSYKELLPDVGAVLHTPVLTVDARGFWYAEPLPLPPDATLDGSVPVSGPYHLFRFDGT